MGHERHQIVCRCAGPPHSTTLDAIFVLHLVAHFEVDLPGQCLIAWPDDRPLLFECTIDTFDISISLIAHDHWRMKRKNENDWTQALRAALVKVSREEIEQLPPVHPD